MPYCDESKYPRNMIVLTFLSVILGAVVSLFAAGVFAYKWVVQLDDQFKRNRIPILCAIVIGFSAMERTVRTLEVCYLWWNASKLTTDVFHVSNNVCSVIGIFGCLFLLLLVKLQISFEGSAFSIPDNEIRVLYSCIIVDIVISALFWVFNGTPSLNSTSEGQWTTFALSATALILSLSLVGRIDFNFGHRLRDLVASSAVHCRPTSTTLSTKISFDENGIPEQGPIERMRSSTLSDYEEKHQSLLKTAAKSMVLAVWISFGIFLSFFSGFLFSYGTCANLWTVAGHVCLAMTYFLCAMAILFTLPHCQTEYDWMCKQCDYLIRKVVAIQTTHQVLVLHNQYSSNKVSGDSSRLESCAINH